MTYQALRTTRVAAACLAVLAIASACSDAGGEQLVASAQVEYARVNIDKLGRGELDAIKGHPGVRQSVELDRQLLVLASRAAVDDMSTRYEVVPLDVPPRPENLCLVHRSRRQEEPPDGAVLAWSSDRYVVQTSKLEACPSHDRSLSPLARPLRGNEVVVQQLGSQASLSAGAPLPHTSNVVGALDMDRWLSGVAKLSSFDRYALRPSNISQAEEWIAGEFCTIAGLGLSPAPPNGGTRCEHGHMSVRTQAFPLGTVGGRNIVLTLGGFLAQGPVFVIGAHYDSIAKEVGATLAPGAEDNASGTAGVIEMARAIARYPRDATFVFVAFSGEEEGLVGSTYHVRELASTALAQRIRGVFIMDMIGYSGDAELDCLLETTDTPGNQELLAHMRRMAATFAPQLVLSTTTSPSGSDHVPFLDAGYTGLLAIENDFETYPFYHSKNDTVANQNARFRPMANLIVRMNTAAVAEWSAPNAFFAALSVVLG